jgi:anti-sigma B factor antagonist
MLFKAGTVDDVASPEFAVDVLRRDDTVVVRPRGELDLATVHALRAAVEANASVARLVLDLRGLSFIDSTGLCLLVSLHRRAQRDRVDLSLVMPPEPAQRTIALSGLDRVLPFLVDEPSL